MSTQAVNSLEKTTSQFPPIPAAPASSTVEKTHEVSQGLSKKNSVDSERKVRAHKEKDTDSFDETTASRKELQAKVTEQRKILEDAKKENTRLQSSYEQVFNEKKQLLDDLNDTQVQLKNIEAVTEELAKIKKQFDELKNNTDTECKTTLLSKEIKHDKQQLAELHDELSKNIQLVMNAVLKKEVPEAYAKDEAKIYAEASKNLAEKAKTYQLLADHLKSKREDFVNAIRSRNELADDNNDSLVLSERVEQDLKFYEKSIAYPHHLKTFSDKVSNLLSSLTQLIEHDYIDTENYNKLALEIESSKKSSDAESGNKETAKGSDQDKLVAIKSLYKNKFKLVEQHEALRKETDNLFKQLKEIQEYKKLHLDAFHSQESKQTKIAHHFNQLNESVQYWEKGFVPQANLKNYELYNAEKKEDLIVKLKATQEKSLENHIALRNWCALTRNNSFNNLDLAESLLDLVADRVKVNNPMSLTLGEMAVLKNEANTAPKNLRGEPLAKELGVLEPRFKSITDKMRTHYKEYLELQKKYDDKIRDISNLIDKNAPANLDKKTEAYAIHAQLPKDTVVKNIISTLTDIKAHYEQKKSELSTEWNTLYKDRFWNTCRDFETIVDTIKASWTITWGLKTLGAVNGEYTKAHGSVVNLASTPASGLTNSSSASATAQPNPT